MARGLCSRPKWRYCERRGGEGWRQGGVIGARARNEAGGRLPPICDQNKMPKVISVGCVGPWKHNGVLSEFGKIRETGKICHVMSIDE